jgi:hypothetical protein
MHDEMLAYQRRTYKAEIVEALERGLEKGGYESAFKATADLLAEWYGKPGRRVRAWDVARRYLEAGDHEQAIDWLEKACDDHEPNLPYLGWPMYDSIRSDPRFQELYRRIGLPVDERQ